MATYAIGDIHGCLDELQRLLEHIHFNPQHDQLIFAGDLVNRGPKSLETLHFIRQLNKAATVVLGNHDLHCIAAFYQLAPQRLETNLSFIKQFDEQLIQWLCQQHLAFYHESTDCLIVHAGISLQWDLSTTLACANEVEQQLSDPTKVRPLLEHMYGNEPSLWHEELSGHERNRYIINCLTRMRYCKANGQLDFSQNYSPWFDVVGNKTAPTHIIFGHWATLDKAPSSAIIHHIDSGCVYGGKLSALCLENKQIYTIESHYNCLN